MKSRKEQTDLLDMIQHYYDVKLDIALDEWDNPYFIYEGKSRARFMLVECIEEGDSYPLVLGDKYFALICYDYYTLRFPNMGQMAVNPRKIKPLIEVTSLEDIFINMGLEFSGREKILQSRVDAILN